MKWALLLLALVSGAASARDAIGIYGGWGAFRDASPRHCYAIARPVQNNGAAFASVGNWPDQGQRGQVHVRLSRARNPGASVTLSIGERRFELVAGSQDAWAPDSRTDFAIVSAMRSGRSLSVESLDAGGRPFADVYALHGAASAVDAAALACRG